VAVETLYQRWIETDIPADCGGDRAIPMWTWPLPLSDGRALVTFLYRPLSAPPPGAKAQGPRTLILELSVDGEASPWKPGQGYPAPVLFHVSPSDDLVGFDLVNKGKIYACRPDGTHLWSLETRLKMGNLLAPEFFDLQSNELKYLQHDDRYFQATLINNQPQNLREVDPIAHLIQLESHFPHTHITRDGSIWIFDFDPMPRVTRLRIHA